jgi:hypothetical protein
LRKRNSTAFNSKVFDCVQFHFPELIKARHGYSVTKDLVSKSKSAIETYPNLSHSEAKPAGCNPPAIFNRVCFPAKHANY